MKTKSALKDLTLIQLFDRFGTDPLGEVGGLNLYDYVANNSINSIDPLGLAFTNKRYADHSASRG